MHPGCYQRSGSVRYSSADSSYPSQTHAVRGPIAECEAFSAEPPPEHLAPAANASPDVLAPVYLEEIMYY